MSVFRSFVRHLIQLPLKLLVKTKLVHDGHHLPLENSATKPLFYIIRYQSNSDLLTLRHVCLKQGLPDPTEKVDINGESFNRTLFLQKTSSIFPWRKQRNTQAVDQGLAIISKHQSDATLDAQLVPVNLCWGRSPTKEKANMGTLLADDDSPTWIRKFFIILFLGRDTLVRFSKPVSLRYMCDTHGVDKASAQKLMRVARIHFFRQTIAATGPRLMMRKQMFTALFANPSVKKVIEDEAKSKKQSIEKTKKQALDIMDEVAGDYRDSMVRYGESILTWLWRRLYNGIEVENADRLRNLAQEGNEIIYVPCHRSHMDYLLLTYVIYQQGLVTPRIAAGINLNFWPAGPIFRKAGAFFIRRSFGGNRLYSTIFREYLGLLFARGYPVKFYTEGGRSRTGRLLAPKTGMLAMTIQSMLKGIERPLTLVPVYIGYEHVMEVGSYHSELKGNSKQGESVLGVFKAIKKLRNYGKGYVSFGEPISMSHFLNDQVPQWRDAIDPIDPQKPSWLTPTVNVLAGNIMTAINKTASLNPVALVSLILLTQENNALVKADLVRLLAFFIELQKQVPFSHDLTAPDDDAEKLVDDVIKLDKVSVHDDALGQIISLTPAKALELTYYRNNILHTYLLPSFVAKVLLSHGRIAQAELIEEVTRLVKLVKQEFFLWQTDSDIANQIAQTVDYLYSVDAISRNDSECLALTENSSARFTLSVLAECVSETLQRLAIVISLLERGDKQSRSALEKDSLILAKRLSQLHNINGPEFVDKKAQATLVQSLRDRGYIKVDDTGGLIPCKDFEQLKLAVYKLVDTEVLQSIKQVQS